MGISDKRITDEQHQQSASIETEMDAKFGKSSEEESFDDLFNVQEEKLKFILILICIFSVSCTITIKVNDIDNLTKACQFFGGLDYVVATDSAYNYVSARCNDGSEVSLKKEK